MLEACTTYARLNIESSNAGRLWLQAQEAGLLLTEFEMCWV